MNLTWDPVLAEVPTPVVHSAAIPLGKGITVHLSLLGWDKTGGLVSVHTLHCTHVKSHLTLQKRVGPLWRVMIDDNAPTHERRKLVKTYKMCSLENRLWLLRYAGRPTPKIIKKDGVEKRPQT